MLWNWDTIDSCFLDASWHVASVGMFAGSCIAVIVLTILLMLLRRLSSMYDQCLARRHREAMRRQQEQAHHQDEELPAGAGGNDSRDIRAFFASVVRPELLEQIARALFFAAQSALSLIIML